MSKSIAKQSTRSASISEAVACTTCGARFATSADLAAHSSIKTTHGPCLSLSSMFSTGWRSAAGIWSAPVKPATSRRGRPAKGAADPDSIHECVMCAKQFTNAEAFKAHFIAIDTDPSELAPGRLQNAPCLDTDELRALDFGRTANGVWKCDPWTLKRPADALRLPTVRAPLFASQDARFMTVAKQA